MNEKEIKILNESRMSAALIPLLKPVLEEIRGLSLSKMKQYYRAGTGTQVNLTACVAELIAVDDIESRLMLKIKRAQGLGEING